MEALILLASPFRYVWLRLRWASLQKLISIGIRWAEWQSFENLISHRFAFAYLAFRYSLEFLIRYRWSMLEDSRAALIALKHAKQRLEFQTKVQELWKSTWSSLVVVVPVLVLLVTYLVSTRVKNTIPATGVLVFVMVFLHFLADWVFKTLQSVLYTTTRVHRPFWSMSGLDLLHGMLLFTVARTFGTLGIGLVFMINTGLRIAVTWHFLQKTLATVGLSRLEVPKIKNLKIQFKTHRVLSGLSLPFLHLAFLISLLIYFRAMKEMDPDGEYLFLIYLVSPLFVFASSFGFLYYVDFLKYKERVFQKLYTLLLHDSARAVGAYSLLFVGVLSILNQKATEEPISGSTLAIIGLVLFSWGLFFTFSMAAFIKGARRSLVIIGFVTALALASSPNVEFLIGFSIGIPTLGALYFYVRARRASHDPVEKACVSPELIPNNHPVQGVTLQRTALGFSYSATQEALLKRLPAGSKMSYWDRITPIWWTPDGTRLSSKELLEVFGVHWDRELGELPKARTHEIPAHAVDWTLGRSARSILLNATPQERNRLWGFIRRRVAGRPRPAQRCALGFIPRFENGIWVGGKIWKKIPRPPQV